MRARSPSDRPATEGRGGRALSSPFDDPTMPTTTTTKFTAVNSGSRSRTPTQLDSPPALSSGSRFHSGSKNVAPLWRPANGDGRDEASLFHHDMANDGPTDGDFSDDNNTIRVARLPRKRKRSDVSVINNPDGNVVGPAARPPSPRPPHPTSSDRDEPPKRRRSNMDIVNDWNARAEKEQRPSLHLITDELTPEPAEESSTSRRRESPSITATRHEPPTVVHSESERMVRRSIDDPVEHGPNRRTHASKPPSDAMETPTRAGVAHVSPTEPGETSSPREDEVIGDATKGSPQGPSEVDEDQKKQRKRKFTNRTKTGCHTCRNRKKKCDERKPVCLNCERGNFDCGGYGVKPPNARGQHHHRAMMPLQSKQPYEQPPIRSTEHFYPPPTNPISPDEAHHRQRAYAQYPPHPDGRRYAESLPVEPQQRYSVPFYPSAAHSWHGQERPHQAPPPPPPPPPPSSAYPADRPAPVDYHHRPPLPPPPGSVQHYEAPPPPPPPPPPPAVDLWHSAPPSQNGPYRPSHGPALTVLSHSSSGSGGRGGGGGGNPTSAAQAAIGFAFPAQQTEKDKMLRGQPFKHWIDSTLIQDRRECKAALQRFNAAVDYDDPSARHQHQLLFHQVLQPMLRPQLFSSHPQQQQQQQQQHHHHHHSHPGHHQHQQQLPPPATSRITHIGPEGSSGTRTLVSSPFSCLYGYNIHFGVDCVVESSCFFQDAADISIGNRVIIANFVQLLCLIVPVDLEKRRGGQGEVVAGAIDIRDDVFIGAGATVLAYRTIGKGAVVAAGSVVTKDVEEYSVVAGVPAKRIRRNINEAFSNGLESESTSRSLDIRLQNEEMKRRMMQYAEAGFRHQSPRLL